MSLTPFHIAVQVRDINEAILFYGGLLGLKLGRRDANWVDFNMFGHQYVCHLNPGLGKDGKVELHHNSVDSNSVPVPHAGVVMEMKDWMTFSSFLKDLEIDFIIEPHIRFEGQAGEQATMFFYDPTGNALEFKAFKDIEDELFKTE
jgi:hypothetical protein